MGGQKDLFVDVSEVRLANVVSRSGEIAAVTKVK
jgi:hypothetical protein